MTREEYDTKIKTLAKIHMANKRHVMREYAFANNPYKVGDIIEDHHHIIKIERYQAIDSWEYPSCLYFGIELKKDLTPKKRQDGIGMYQVNVKRKIK
jgi:hypothetical protein